MLQYATLNWKFFQKFSPGRGKEQGLITRCVSRRSLESHRSECAGADGEASGCAYDVMKNVMKIVPNDAIKCYDVIKYELEKAVYT
jgi:hypothetical protein